VAAATHSCPADEDLHAEATDALKRAVSYFAGQVATEGGYVYYYTEDLTRRWGEGEATPIQIWVHPPGTPAVGEAMLAAWRATGDPNGWPSRRDSALGAR